MRQRISRRTFVRHGAAGLAAAIPIGIATERLITARPSRDKTDASLTQLVAPIAVGTQLGPVSVAAIDVDKRGIGVVTMTDAHGHEWHAEIARRTGADAALNPLALSKHYSLYLRNGGSGTTPTDQGVGRAVLAIARHVERNENAMPVLTLASRAELWAATGYRRADASV
jgi:hypothetical protein